MVPVLAPEDADQLVAGPVDRFLVGREPRGERGKPVIPDGVELVLRRRVPQFDLIGLHHAIKSGRSGQDPIRRGVHAPDR